MSTNSKVYYFSKLIYKSVCKTINIQEKKELENWLKEKSNRELYDKIIQKEAILKKEELYKKSNKEEVYKRIQQKIHQKIHQKKQPKLFKLRLLSFVKYAAILIFIFVIGKQFYNSSVNEVNSTEKVSKEIKPGSEKAILILSDGTKVDLNAHKHETIISNTVAQINNTNDGLVYNSKKDTLQINTINEPLKYNTLQVPIGGIYKVKLPDGTKVWLNSATSLTYPEKFSGAKRLVKLEGEAYFEVTKNAKEFIVETTTASVTVLGTHFNVSSYKDDSFFSSTLVEGKVRLNTSQKLNENDNSVILAPNQRGILDKESSKIKVHTVDASVFTAWKEGKFYFEKERLDNILTRMARWYNVTIIFEDASLKEETFTGVMLKNKSIDDLLYLISRTTKINYTITKNKTNDAYELKLSRN